MPQRITAASLRGRKDGNDATGQARMVMPHQLAAANGGPIEVPGERDEEVVSVDDSLDIGDTTLLSGAMLKAHKKQLKARRKKVRKKKKKHRRDPDPDLVFDPYQLKKSDSFSECRLCLDPGQLRGCCGQYYCNKCFYKTEFCPGCDTSIKSLVMLSDDANDRTKNSYGYMEVGSLFRGFVAKVLAYAVVLGGPAGLAYGFLFYPSETLHGYQCTGFMPNCEVELCSNFRSHLDGHGTYYYDKTGACDNGLPGECVCSLGCVYDEHLYSRTRGALGLDYCKEKFNSWSVVMQDHFDQATWDPTGWSDIKNAKPLTYCRSSSGNASLVFRGEVVYRRATTVELDVRNGARVEFRMIYGSDKGCVDCCQDLYSPGTVTLSISNHGGAFEPYQTYGIHDYKKDEWQKVSEEIPAARLSNATRFRWHQDRFARYRDTWALDNVTILAQALPEGWESTSQWLSQRKRVRSKIANASCCFDSDLCSENRAEPGYSVPDETLEACRQDFSQEQSLNFSANILDSRGVTRYIDGVVTSWSTTDRIRSRDRSEYLDTERYVRADDGTYALFAAIVLWIVRWVFLQGQRRCPVCGPCKEMCCPDKVLLQRRRAEARAAQMRKAQEEEMEERAKEIAAANAAAEVARAERASAMEDARERARMMLLNEEGLSRKSRGRDFDKYIKKHGWHKPSHPNFIDDREVSKQWARILQIRTMEIFTAEAKRTGKFQVAEPKSSSAININSSNKAESRAAAYVVKESKLTSSQVHNTLGEHTEDEDEDEDSSDLSEVDKDEITTSVIDFPVMVDKCWLSLFLVLVWIPVLGCAGYAVGVVFPQIGGEIRALTIPTHFAWTTTTEDSIVDYRNIHKGVIPRKEPTYEQLVENQYYPGDLWERVWKYGARKAGAEIGLPVPRILCALFAVFIDLWVAYALSKQVRVDEILRTCTQFCGLPVFLQARPPFVLSLYHHAGEMMDIQSTLLKDHLIFDDLPRSGKSVDFADKHNERIGAIQLRRIRSTIGVKPSFAKFCGAVCVWSGIPWGILTLICSDSRGILYRAPGIMCGIMLCIRTFGGPLAFLEGCLLFQAFTSMNAFKYWTLSTHVGKSYCVKGGFFCSIIGMIAGATILAVFHLTTEFGWQKSHIAFGQLWIPMMVVASGAFLIIGFVFGCRRNLPTYIIPILTSLGRDRPGTLIRFSQIKRCGCAPPNLTELCIQETTLLVFVEDARDLDSWIKCHYMMS